MGRPRPALCPGGITCRFGEVEWGEEKRSSEREIASFGQRFEAKYKKRQEKEGTYIKKVLPKEGATSYGLTDVRCTVYTFDIRIF